MRKKYIGNIITTSKRPNFNKLCKICRDYEEIEPDIPTLIIGLDLAKKYIPDFNILNKEYNSGMILWTFRKMERHDDFDNDIKKFYSLCYDRIFKDVKYTYFNITRYGINYYKKIINFFDSTDDEKICFLTKNSNFLFTYSSRYNIVFGLSLSLLEYNGISKDKVKRRIKENPSNIFIYNTNFMDKDVYSIIGNNTHIIPVIYTYL